jgi:hypothetical protein
MATISSAPHTRDTRVRPTVLLEFVVAAVAGTMIFLTEYAVAAWWSAGSTLNVGWLAGSQSTAGRTGRQAVRAAIRCRRGLLTIVRALTSFMDLLNCRGCHQWRERPGCVAEHHDWSEP